MSDKQIKKLIEEMMEDVCLGDAVYASFDGYQIWLKTSDGISITNKIAIDPEVQLNLLKYLEYINKKTREILNCGKS